MTDSRNDVIVIGAGIVGLAVAAEISRRFPKVRLLVLEKEEGVARHQSGHNSGVIHSGVYYKPGSLKARLCVAGAAAMVEFCRDNQVAHRVCGKVIVATEERELPLLEEVRKRGEANGVAGLRLIGAEELAEIEPHARGLRALAVPSTAVTDYVAVCEKYAARVVTHGGVILTSAKVNSIRRRSGEIVLETTRGTCAAKYAINCGGLFSDSISRMAGDEPDVSIVPFRGEYYDFVSETTALVKALIYPVPDPQFPFLGVHFTRRVNGHVDAGPNAVLAFRREGYQRTDFSLAEISSSVLSTGFRKFAATHWRMAWKEFHRSFSKTAFVRALQRLVPAVREDMLVPGGSGVRAQALRHDGTIVDDFLFLQSANMLHVLNVPSPAATASLLIARAIVDIASKNSGWPD